VTHRQGSGDWWSLKEEVGEGLKMRSNGDRDRDREEYRVEKGTSVEEGKGTGKRGQLEARMSCNKLVNS
jgi:hypothetical protein